MKKDKHKDKTEKKKKIPIPHRPEEEKKKKIKKNNRTKAPFMQVDRGGDILSNFFSNFLRQLKNPRKTGLGRLLGKLLFVKIEESQKKPEKTVNIMGPVKTVFRHVSNGGNNLSPIEKESLRQRQNQPLNIPVKLEQSKDEELNKPRKIRLGM